jgi:hypothetical protein
MGNLRQMGPAVCLKHMARVLLDIANQVSRSCRTTKGSCHSRPKWRLHQLAKPWLAKTRGMSVAHHHVGDPGYFAARISEATRTWLATLGGDCPPCVHRIRYLNNFSRKLSNFEALANTVPWWRLLGEELWQGVRGLLGELTCKQCKYSDPCP